VDIPHPLFQLPLDLAKKTALKQGNGFSNRIFGKREGKKRHSPPSFSVTFGFGKKDRAKTRTRVFK